MAMGCMTWLETFGIGAGIGIRVPTTSMVPVTLEGLLRALTGWTGAAVGATMRLVAAPRSAATTRRASPTTTLVSALPAVHSHEAPDREQTKFLTAYNVEPFAILIHPLFIVQT
jgi:hypothetical protein